MAVYQRAYRGYAGVTSAPGARVWVIARYALAEAFASRLFVMFFGLCFVPPVVVMCAIYLRYNIEVLTTFDLPLDALVPIDAAFFAGWVQEPQSAVAFLLILFVGPTLISPDVRNNAMPLFLSRAIGKRHYVAGKLLVLLTLGSLVTWVPGLMLVLFQAVVGETGWLARHWRVPLALVAASLVWIVSLSMLALMVSAWIRWKPVARLAFFCLVFIASALGTSVRETFGGWYGSLLSLFDLQHALVSAFFGVPSGLLIPQSAVAAAFVIMTCAATTLLVRRIRASEIG